MHGKSFIDYLSCFLLNFLLYSCVSYAEIKSEQPPEIGNFSLPSSQQPGAFLSFGQNTLEKGKTQLYFFTDKYVGDHQYFIDAIPSIVYGFSDNLSIYFTVPFAVNYQQESHHSAGLKDLLLQLEYTFYSNETKDYSDTGTIVLNTSFPTGSSTKNPPTGFGSEAFFLGGTFSRLYTQWLGFVSPGVLVPTAHNGTKYGSNFLYEFGLGKNIAAEKGRYIFSWLLELDGSYFQKNKINGATDPNSGGNIIYLTPSLWYSTQHLILQGGPGWAITQHWYGDQPKIRYLIAINLGWTF